MLTQYELYCSFISFGKELLPGMIQEAIRSYSRLPSRTGSVSCKSTEQGEAILEIGGGSRSDNLCTLPERAGGAVHQVQWMQVLVDSFLIEDGRA